VSAPTPQRDKTSPPAEPAGGSAPPPAAGATRPPAAGWAATATAFAPACSDAPQLTQNA